MWALTAGALALLTFPAAAGATDYGGGTAPDRMQRANRQLTLVAFRMADDGTGRVAVKVAAGCAMAQARRAIGLATDGTFALAATDNRRLPGGVRRRSEITLTGQMVGPVASGTVRARLTFRRRGRVVQRCNSGTREWNARAAVAGGAPAAPQPETGYHGLTDQTARPFPFVLRVGPGARRVQAAAFVYHQKCRRGPFEWENVTPGAEIRPDGSFSLRERFTYRWAEGRERFRVKVDGRFTATGVSGTLSVSSILRSPSGRTLDRCTTGRRSFAAVP
jgi:hypothetical protein